MKLLAITAPGDVALEVETITALFIAGLEILHLRKPKWSASHMAELLDGIDPAYHSRVTVHSNYELLKKYQLGGVHLPSWSREPCNERLGTRFSRSCHSVKEVEGLAGSYDYLFISPVFDSVSKKGYLSALSIDELYDCTNRTGERLVALGGITSQTLPELSTNICWGAAVLGTIWQHSRVVGRVRAFRELKEIADRL